MAKAKMDFWTMDINMTFKTEKEARQHVNKLEDKFRNILENNKGYKVQAVIGASSLSGKRVLEVYSEGRKRIKVLDESEQTKLAYGDLNNDWHIHLLVVSQPSEMVRQMIKDYIDKNWSVKKKCYKKDADVDMIFYICNQSSFTRYVGACDNRFEYSLKKLFEEYIKINNLKRKNKYYINEEALKVANEKRFNDMLVYFRGFTIERQRAKKEEHKKKVRIRKIKEKYEQMGIVQKSIIDVDVKDVFITRD